MDPKVTLVSWTKDPIETIFRVWQIAKSEESWSQIEPKIVGYKVGDPKYRDLVEKIFTDVVAMAIPVSEFIDFVFSFENVTIAWREQLVRHRTNAYWIQSGRISDNSKFYTEGRFHNPFPNEDGKTSKPIIVYDDRGRETIINYSDKHGLFNIIMLLEQEAFKALKEMGAKDEDAREILGNGIHHRLSMKISLRHLIDMCKHRTCWIAQGHWGAIVTQMIDELVTKVHPIFRMLGKPPCSGSGKCAYNAICQDRYDGKDPLPVCPLWLERQHEYCKLTRDQLRELGRWDGSRVETFKKL